MAKLSKWEQSAEALRGVLPKPLCTRRCELLPQVLEEWERSSLVIYMKSWITWNRKTDTRSCFK